MNEKIIYVKTDLIYEFSKLHHPKRKIRQTFYKNISK